MANTIQIKRSNTSTNVPTLVYGELAINVADKYMWYGDASGTRQNITELIPKADDDGSTLGLAAFVNDDFDATNGVVSIATNAIEEGNIEDGAVSNAKLVNDSVTVGSTEIDLGTTSTSLSGLHNIDCAAGTRSIYSSIGSGNTLNIGATGATVRIPGNLQVDGDTITANVETITVEDPQIELAKSNSADAYDIGVYGKYVESATDKYTGIFRDATDGVWKVYDSLESAPNATDGTVITGATENYAQGDFSANIVESTINCGTF